MENGAVGKRFPDWMIEASTTSGNEQSKHQCQNQTNINDAEKSKNVVVSTKNPRTTAAASSCATANDNTTATDLPDELNSNKAIAQPQSSPSRDADVELQSSLSDTTASADVGKLESSTSAAAGPAQHTRSRCQFGSNCYRRNPQHKRDFSHPGDDDYDDQPGLDLPECEYGTKCYRKNPQHRLQYAHNTTPVDTPPPPKRKRRKQPPDRDSDDDLPNTYDRNDSFIDDEEELSDGAEAESDSDYEDEPEPEAQEDVTELVAEAEEFVQNPK